MASSTRPRASADMEERTEATSIRKFDYEEFARRSGEEAYQDAKDAGLPEPIARRFKEVFGSPIEPDFRPS
jgi:hypothetical protein